MKKISKPVVSYYSNKSYEGYITIVRQQKSNPNDFYVYLSRKKIVVSEKQYKELSKLYKEGHKMCKIRAKLRLKKSLFSQRILSAKLISYRVKSVLTFPYSLHKANLLTL